MVMVVMLFLILYRLVIYVLLILVLMILMNIYYDMDQYKRLLLNGMVLLALGLYKLAE